MSLPLGNWTTLSSAIKALFDVESKDCFDGNLFMRPGGSEAVVSELKETS